MSSLIAVNERLSSLVRLESVKVLLAFALLAACSQISIPLQPVPITLQTVGITFLGLMYTRQTALKSVLLYLGAGAAGLPVFADYSGGITKFFGPTGGYLVGFLACVTLMTWLSQKPKMQTLLGMFANCIAGTLIIFIAGVAWLSHFVGLAHAIEVGVLPFIIPGAVKAFILASAVRAFKLPL